MAAPLTDDDVQQLFETVISGWLLERLDTRWGTDECVRYLRSHFQCYGGSHGLPGFPFSDGSNPEWWAFRFDQEGAKGFTVKVVHEFRDDRPTVTVREGRVGWNRLANMATLEACERFGSSRDRGGFAPDPEPAEPAPGQQLTLTV